MVSQNLTLTPDWQQQADQFLLSGNYHQAAQLYEQAIAAAPEIKSYYWHLGLILLLEGQETEAQTTWLLAMAEGESEEIDLWTIELMEVLQAEAERRELELTDYSVAWAIRQHLREINPTEINNLLQLIELSILLGTYTGNELTDLGVIELLKSEPARSVDSDRLVQFWKQILYIAPFHPSSFDLTEVCLPYVKEPLLFLDNLIEFIYKISYSAKRFTLGVRFTELGLRLAPEHPELLRTLSCLYQDIHDYDRGIETAKLCYSLMDNLADKIYANHLIMRGLMSAGGYWDEFTSVIERHKLLLGSLSKEQPTYLDSSSTIRLLSSSFFFPYFQDDPKENVKIRSQVAQLCQLNVENYAKAKVEQYRHRHSSIVKREGSRKRLKIGYISYCLRTHSVGSLARWLFQYHNHDRFEINAYFLAAEHTCDPVQDWYISKVDRAYKLGLDGAGTAERIYEDEIDILIELDSLTLNNTCEIMAMKPAPIQATWLGWDASGVPAVDYYIADPYVLPESAQEYYTEKIWRLPQTYIAVDGFEVGVPTLRRENLNIPSDAVIYLSAQRGYKYNPNTVRLQMQILQAVPNSYFIVKGLADQEALKNFFIQIATSEGVDEERLRFLPLVASEAEHRANLGIADVVLDTYPYNGATTTMETLWMGIPIVTRVGEQFSSRNSYTMMMNAGITEGIAWTDREYVEWGIRLGKDQNLRQQIAWTLRQSRQTAPLWNGKQFTHEMEKAYEQMWQKYCALEKHS
ncbi:O-linked N-acetylglucosamine transferase, SPINDLY family protein [Tychonema sp. BBK16]|uniref:O-linked N-acetylglucosamine transferase, SPINDLY family protein n=1 Tax=Tychonema sp. BBK16 TaxID=2699888 RepID=UPI001F1FC220|nr:O-linked N-acetylglucosamine transferase, SPINDLY family protein [Tychonema sp. BBK16]MCF6371590.1 O-linked N-acetylglucosamine transferase, SPINDLY family protein [Tychonema sp. BBK16]